MEGGFSPAQEVLQSWLNTSVFPWHKIQRILNLHVLEASPPPVCQYFYSHSWLIFFFWTTVSIDVIAVTPLFLSIDPCSATVFFMALGLSYGLSLFSAAYWKWGSHSRSCWHFSMKQQELLFPGNKGPQLLVMSKFLRSLFVRKEAHLCHWYVGVSWGLSSTGFKSSHVGWEGLTSLTQALAIVDNSRASLGFASFFHSC